MSILSAVATALPKHTYRQADILAYMLNAGSAPDAASARYLRSIYQQSAIQTRYSVLPDFNPDNPPRLFTPSRPVPAVEDRLAVYQEAAPPLAAEALEQAVGQLDAQLSGFSLGEITHLITVSCTGLAAPGLELELMRRLALSPRLKRLGVNFMGCYAVFPALQMAHALCQADSTARVAVVSVELCTLHFHPQPQKDDWMANALFADGAAAALVLPDHLQDSLSGPVFRLEAFESRVEPRGEADMAWRVTAEGFRMRLSSYIPDLLEGQLEPLLAAVLPGSGSVNPLHFALHPGGRRILDTAARLLELPTSALAASYSVLSQFGNLSSATILFVLAALNSQFVRQGLSKPQAVAAAGFGPGLTLESAALTWLPGTAPALEKAPTIGLEIPDNQS